MKKITGLLLLVFLLGGCLLPGETTRDTVLKDERPGTEEKLSNEGQEEVEQLSQEKKAELLRKQQQFYAFSTLPVTEQNLYVEMLYALTGYVEEMEMSTTDTETIDRVFQCVMMDHPEIFYADGYSFVKYTLGDEVKKITFSGTYIFDREERIYREKVMEEAIKRIISGIAADASDYDKVKYVYEWIIDHTEYNREAEDNQNICSVFLNGQSVCQGYAKATQLLLQQMGIPSTLVTGTVDNGEGHAWNLILIDNEYYYVDTTWGDASYLFQNEEEGGERQLPEINYDYLCVTTKELERTHSFDDLIPLPECRATEANYYVREGAWFDKMDQDQLKELSRRYYDEGRETMTLKCADEAVYQEMLGKLLEEQQIFNYLQPEGDSILYTDSPGQLSITFWL
ncbi:MAG: hypothetical protein IJP31_07475 [Lachnospiraceae bacterium]|nr:hypothetical protein [Lachnospiraceae bacterium]